MEDLEHAVPERCDGEPVLFVDVRDADGVNGDDHDLLV
jgi:hypothetical protein